MTQLLAKLSVVATVLAVCSSSVFAGPIYYGDALIDRGGADQAKGMVGLHAVIPQTGVVTHWNYWADQTGNQLTPLIFKVSNDELEITAIGATHSPTGVGDQGGLPFNLVSGSAEVVAGEHRFGHYDGDPNGKTNVGTISMEGGGASNWAVGGDISPSRVVVGNTLQESALNRQYSIQIGVEEVVPEPSSIVILLVGLIAGLGLFGRRRRTAT
jgi:hypothetical protein